MPAATDRTEFAPPPQPGLMRGLAVAIVAHLLLLLALTVSVQWKRDAENLSAEAELWSALPQQAAPPEPVVQPPPPVAPPVVRAPPEPQVNREAEIAIEREKERRRAEEEEERREELERQRDRQKRLEAQRKQDELKKQQKLEQQRELAEAKRKEDDKRKRQAEQDAKKVAQLREENLRRMQGMAGSGSPTSTGAAARSSGPSDSWGGRIRARVRPNIVFSEDLSGNPTAEVEVRMAPDGTITSKRLVKSSGVRAWDDAVLRALDKTEVLPRDVDGRIHSPVVIEFRPKG
jgi:colicin import membrane protein